jgi:hypothetical protein
MDDLDTIEHALKSTLVHTSPMGQSWFEEHWKPKFDRIRALMISPALRKAVYDIVFEMMECEPWHAPFDELQVKASVPE